MRNRTDGEPRFLGMLRDEHAERARVFEGSAHDQRIGDTVAVVGEHPDLADAGCHGCHLGKLLAFEPDGDSTDRVDVDQADFLTATPNMVGDDHGVGDR